MPDETTPGGVLTELPPLTDEDKAKAKQLMDYIKSEQKADAVNVSTRPTFGAPTVVDAKNVDRNLPIFKRGYLPAQSDVDKTDEDRFEGVAPFVNYFPKGDIENFRATRWAMATERAQNTTSGSAALLDLAPWEKQYYEALAHYGRTNTKAQGEMVSGQDGGWLAPEQWATTLIDQIYAAQVLSQLPITRIPMGTRVTHVPRLSSAVSISYSAENASLTSSQAQFQQVSFTARKQYGFMQISNELIRDSNPTAEDILRNNAKTWMALDRDKQAILGTGLAGAPVGLLNQTNVTANGTLATAATPLFSEFNTGVYNVENLNGSTNVPVGQTQCTGILGMVAVKPQIMNMKDSNNRPLYDFGVNQMRGSFPNSGGGMFDGLFGVPKFAFTNIFGEAANSRHLWFGDWQHLWIMERQDVEIVSSNVAGTAFQADQTWVRLIARYDVGVAHPEAFYAFNND